MIKILAYLLITTLFFTGCSVKEYTAPKLDVVIKDAQTKEGIKDAKLFFSKINKSMPTSFKVREKKK